MRRLLCWLLRHELEPTGLRGDKVEQVRCACCGGLFLRPLGRAVPLTAWTNEWELFSLESGWSGRGAPR